MNNDKKIINDYTAYSGNLVYRRAEKEDIPGMLVIEEEFFNSYDLSFTQDSMTSWLEHNPEMFYVVENKKGEVLAFSVLAPVTLSLYKKILEGEVRDLHQFKKSEVLKGLKSDYSHLEQICVSRVKTKEDFGEVASILIVGLARIVDDNTKFITTYPVTPDGLKITALLDFEKVTNQECQEGMSSIWLLEWSKTTYDKIKHFFMINEDYGKELNRQKQQ